MADPQVFPEIVATNEVQTYTPAAGVFIRTTNGLARTVNEDRVSYRTLTNGFAISLSDGHWGAFAASTIATDIIDNEAPATPEEARKIVRAIEQKLWNAYDNKASIDASIDKPPEAAFSAAWYDRDQHLITIISYGDVRSAVIQQDRAVRIKTYPTWLGAFSYMSLRERIPIDKSLQFLQFTSEPGDKLLLYSDGIDECIYEIPTIPQDEIEETVRSSATTEQATDILLAKVFSHGAEDNATIAVAELA